MALFVQAAPGVFGTRARETELRRLRALRRLCVAIAVVCVGVLPFELRAATLPPSVQTSLVQMPVVGPYFASRPSLRVWNYPHSVDIGGIERFHVQLTGVANIPLFYEVHYPNGHVLSGTDLADATGFSHQAFRLRGYTLRHPREKAFVRVRNADASIQAYLNFSLVPAAHSSGTHQ